MFFHTTYVVNEPANISTRYQWDLKVSILPVTGGWLVAILGRFVKTPIVSCSSSWTSCRCKIGRANSGNLWPVMKWWIQDKFQTCCLPQPYWHVYTLSYRSFNKRRGLPHEWLGISLQSARSVISLAISLLYLPIFSSLFSRVFSWSKSLPDSRLNISSLQLKTCSLASYFLHYVLCYSNDYILFLKNAKHQQVRRRIGDARRIATEFYWQDVVSTHTGIEIESILIILKISGEKWTSDGLTRLIYQLIIISSIRFISSCWSSNIATPQRLAGSNGTPSKGKQSQGVEPKMLVENHGICWLGLRVLRW